MYVVTIDYEIDGKPFEIIIKSREYNAWRAIKEVKPMLEELDRDLINGISAKEAEDE